MHYSENSFVYVRVNDDAIISHPLPICSDLTSLHNHRTKMTKTWKSKYNSVTTGKDVMTSQTWHTMTTGAVHTIDIPEYCLSVVHYYTDNQYWVVYAFLKRCLFWAIQTHIVLIHVMLDRRLRRLQERRRDEEDDSDDDEDRQAR